MNGRLILLDASYWHEQEISTFVREVARLDGQAETSVCVLHDSDTACPVSGPRVIPVAARADWDFARRVNSAVRYAGDGAQVVVVTCPLTSGSVPAVVAGFGRLAHVGAHRTAVRTAEGPRTTSEDPLDPRCLLYFTRESHENVRGFNEYLKSTGLIIADFVQRIANDGVATDTSLDFNAVCREELHEPIAESQPPTDRIFANLPVWASAPKRPIVSVVIATRNREDYIADAVYSVLGQTMPDLELVIVDDGSDDGTLDVLGKIDDPRLRVFQREKSGIASARNFATSVARGNWIAVHDDDDIMMPERLERQMQSLRAGDSGSYGAWANFDNLSGEFIVHLTRRWFAPEVVMHNGQSPGHPTWLVRRRLLEALQYDERLSSAVDHDVALRSLRLGARWRHFGGVATLRRVHDGQVSATDATSQKAAAVIRRGLSRASHSTEDLAAAVAKQGSVPWPVIPGREDAASTFGGELPDHLVFRQAVVSRNAFKAITDAGLEGKVEVVCGYLDQEGNVSKELAVLDDLSLKDVALIRRNRASVEVVHSFRDGADLNDVDADAEDVLLEYIVRNTHLYAADATDCLVIADVPEADQEKWRAIGPESGGHAVFVRSSTTVRRLVLWPTTRSKSSQIMSSIGRKHPAWGVFEVTRSKD
ncbi:glycosyltransferase family A protein [Isoptericola sp. 178]|uniref:glycosyltransferase family 2 protein n=1 Tax=Isoptericola sp. 178 TaxID=3064651 RepID=UPI002713890C|nr:glycosyltransferase family A protein [Isoptericola sp. 178]MDO8143933.1 glycosyltransferase family A protein [Isoptericola sp. 178]